MFEAESRVGQFIRSTHPHAYRSGEWARIQMTVEARDRECWLIEFSDMKTDIWIVDDPTANYEFAPFDASL